MAFSRSLAQEMLLNPIFNHKLYTVIGKVMLVSQSRSLQPLFSLKLLQQSKKDAQTHF